MAWECWIFRVWRGCGSGLHRFCLTGRTFWTRLSGSGRWCGVAEVSAGPSRVRLRCLGCLCSWGRRGSPRIGGWFCRRCGGAWVFHRGGRVGCRFVRRGPGCGRRGGVGSSADRKAGAFRDRQSPSTLLLGVSMAGVPHTECEDYFPGWLRLPTWVRLVLSMKRLQKTTVAS
jgi:hypothetical protein